MFCKTSSNEKTFLVLLLFILKCFKKSVVIRKDFNEFSVN